MKRQVRVTTTGRRTGEARAVTLYAFDDGERLVIVGSRGGAAKDPAWAANLRDDPRATVKVGREERGVRATEVDGPYGTALAVRMTGQAPDGKTVTQPSLVLGISGPRWLLRATLLGRPAVQYDDDGLLESALREVVVVRGSTPMAPGDAIALTMPPGARPPGPGGPGGA